MPVIGVGIDVVEIDRFVASLDRTPGLRERLFTPAEATRGAASLAARFAAKEAVAKALELETWAWHDVEVLGAGGPPRVHLSGAAAERAGELGVEVKISLTHTARMAGAVALTA